MATHATALRPLAVHADPLRLAMATYRRPLEHAEGRELRGVMRGRHAAVAVGLYDSPAYDLRVRALDVARLSINLSGSRVSGGVEGERARSFLAQRHSLFLTPAGTPVHWRKSAPSRHLNLYFHPSAALLDERDEHGRQLGDDGPIFNLILPGSAALIQRLALEATEAGPFTPEAVESLAVLLLVLLRRRCLRAAAVQPISSAAMGRLDDYIATHLAERILVADLAAVAGLSPGSFAQGFTRRTGHSPHQYVLARRVERAKAMLRAGRVGLAEIAAACGFSSQQHMGSVLRARLGMTPASLRRALAQAPSTD